jgi:putative salt-induced outer membrane protein YdiY
MKDITLYLTACFMSASLATADLVRTIDGAKLTGTITSIDQGIIHLDTPYAGTLQIKQNQVASFESDEPRVLRLQSGTVMAGPIKGSEDGSIRIQSEDGVLETSAARVAAAWSLGSEDPELVRNQRAWGIETSIDLTGKNGNTDKYRLGTSLDAKLTGPDDELALFFDYEQAEEEGNQTEDRIAGGASYQSFFHGVYGWYVRTELEADAIDSIDLRSTSGAGISYRLINKDHQTLVFRSGLGYRYTGYDNNTDNESSATVDFGLAHSYHFSNRLFIENDLTFVPAINDFGNYHVVHDSGIEIPVGIGENWMIRMGVRNEYESEPATDEHLDTSYYTRIIYSWD